MEKRLLACLLTYFLTYLLTNLLTNGVLNGRTQKLTLRKNKLMLKRIIDKKRYPSPFVLNRILESLSDTTMAQKPVSYRRNRDNSKQFEWTYELNEDRHRCYNKARKDPKIGYMNRLKSY